MKCSSCGIIDETTRAPHNYGAPAIVGDEIHYTCGECGYAKTETKEIIPSTEFITSTDGKATLQIPENSDALIHKDTQLSVEILSVEENQKVADKAADSLALAFEKGTQIATTFDIKLLLDGEAVQPGGKVKITIQIPEAVKNYKNLTIVYVDDEGNVTACESVLNPDGTISFYAEHFSNYSLVGIPPYTPGDVDGSGVVDLDDVIQLLFYLTFPESYPVNQPVDFDGSEAVDLDDVIHLLFHLTFPESYPLH